MQTDNKARKSIGRRHYVCVCVRDEKKQTRLTAVECDMLQEPWPLSTQSME